ncbi:MAG: hypothetical protein IPK78_18155 [Rhodospirillales bacterium]|nr:hypothetical protein [Rhodospirillales bacterium]
MGISAEVLAFCQPGKQLEYTHGFQPPTPQPVIWSVRAIVDDSMVVYVADGSYFVERLAMFQDLYEEGALRPA